MVELLGDFSRDTYHHYTSHGNPAQQVRKAERGKENALSRKPENQKKYKHKNAFRQKHRKKQKIKTRNSKKKEEAGKTGKEGGARTILTFLLLFFPA